MSFVRRLALALACCSAGCGQAEGTLGSVMLAISTDMYVDKDLSQVDIMVQPEHGPTQTAQINLFPGLEGQYLPGTFSITEGSKPGEFVRIRVIARQSERVRVVREAALKIPRRRTALLAMPIQWLCDGHVRPEEQLYRSDCSDGYTCIAGTCQPDSVDETALPDYEPGQVFGGGDPTGNGECFDTVECFSGATEPALDLATCRLSVEPGPDVNVGVVLPPESDGHCTATECWIPLDHSALTGWVEAEGEIQLPVAVCQRVMQGGARVLVSTACASKLPDTPTCGPWTPVGTQPGAPGPSFPGGPEPGVRNADVVLELQSAAQRLAGEVFAACSNAAGVAPVGAATAEAMEAACTEAQTTIQTVAPNPWYHVPTRCYTDPVRRLACESNCDSSCVGDNIAERCTIGLAGVCSGVCESRMCMGSAEAAVDCTGACGGECSGTCEGSCLGTCVGECAAPSPDGHCDGICSGTCIGLCQGRCEGSCAGRCDGDPNIEAAPCGGEALCLAGCSGELSAATCETPLGPSSCGLDAGCEGNCGAIAQFNTSCDRPHVWILSGVATESETIATLEAALPDLVAIRDRKGPTVLDEALRLRDRMTSAASMDGDLASVESAIELLQAAVSHSTAVLAALGAERLGPGPSTPGPISCDVVRATGSAPLIDDFEGSDTLALQNDGRDGSWYVFQDGTGTLSSGSPPIPEDGGANGSGKALHLAGSGFVNWGAGVSVELRQSSAPYDATVHQGLRFWARGTGSLRIILVQANLAPGHFCSTCPTGSSECGVFYKSEIFLSSIWSEIVLPWASFGRDLAGTTGLAADQLMMIQFEAPGPNAFDVWLDDVGFY